MAAFYLLTAVALTTGQALDPDDLYRQREQFPQVQHAADIWAARFSDEKDYEARWKFARASYWIGTHASSQTARRAALERGVAAGTEAAALQPDRPEGHFWMAASMGALAESFGLRQGIRYRGSIKRALERVLAIDAAWQQGSADRALGWWYHQVPGLFGGSEAQAEAHLRKALAFNPQSTATLFFLAEVLVERGRTAEARQTFQGVIDAPLDPDWTPEDRDFKSRAQERLKTVPR